MGNREKIERIIEQLCKYSKTLFAKKVGVAKSTVSSWIERDTMDYYSVAKAFPEISTDWLLLGNGPMLRSEENHTKTEEIAEPAQEYATQNLVTIPSSLLDSLQKQLEIKDEHIAQLIAVINKFNIKM